MSQSVPRDPLPISLFECSMPCYKQSKTAVGKTIEQDYLQTSNLKFVLP